MKMETITVSPGEDRVLLLFDAAAAEAARGRVDEFLKAHKLTPRREYTEERDGKDCLVYYFGHCYLEPHLDAMAAIAGESG
jgi:hypothetical protein